MNEMNVKMLRCCYRFFSTIQNTMQWRWGSWLWLGLILQRKKNDNRLGNHSQLKTIKWTSWKTRIEWSWCRRILNSEYEIYAFISCCCRSTTYITVPDYVIIPILPIYCNLLLLETDSRVGCEASAWSLTHVSMNRIE